MEEEEEKKPLSEQDKMFLIVLFVGALAFFAWAWSEFQKKLSALRRRKKLKSVIAEEYSINQRILLRWITIFCSKSYIDNYAGKYVKKIPQFDIYQTFGRPVRGEVFSKKRLATELFIHRNTLSNQIKKIENFKEKTGMTIEQYDSLRTLPPKQYKLIFDLYNKSYPSLPGLPE